MSDPPTSAADPRGHALPSGPRRPYPATTVQLVAFLGGVLTFLFLLTHSLGPYYTSRLPQGASEAAFRAKLDRSAPDILKHFGIPGVVIATVINGAPAKAYAYGAADLARRRPMGVDTVFSAASISKAVTAWGILRLVETGAIDLDAPARRYLKAWPLPASTFPTDGVTVRRLLDHTAGVGEGDDVFRAPASPVMSAAAVLGREDAGARAPGLRARLVGPAGRNYLYSAPGYSILQMIIENETHQSFGTYMRRAVFQPLGMDSSSFTWDRGLAARTATPYLRGGRASPVRMPQDTAADSLFSTGPDLARFIAAWLPDEHGPAGAGVLSAGSLGGLYRSPAGLSQTQLWGLGDRPAAGCFIEHLADGRTVVTNGGYDPGWSSQFFIVPATGDGVVILTNSQNAEPAIAQIAAVWSSWRGLPPVKMTRAYRDGGVGTALTVALLVMISISFFAHFIYDLAAGSRRLADFHLAAFPASLIECLLALSAMGLWVSARPTLEAMPTFNTVGVAAITFFCLVALVRLVCPLRDGRRAMSPMSAA